MGRLVIPAACRKRLGVNPGQELFLQISEQGLLVYTHDLALTHVYKSVQQPQESCNSLPGMSGSVRSIATVWLQLAVLSK